MKFAVFFVKKLSRYSVNRANRTPNNDGRKMFQEKKIYSHTYVDNIIVIYETMFEVRTIKRRKLWRIYYVDSIIWTTITEQNILRTLRYIRNLLFFLLKKFCPILFEK